MFSYHFEPSRKKKNIRAIIKPGLLIYKALDYNIRGPSPLPYHLGFMVRLAEGGSSSIVPEPRS
jgi:hypothetical protein